MKNSKAKFQISYPRSCQYNLRNTLHHQVDVDNQFHLLYLNHPIPASRSFDATLHCDASSIHLFPFIWKTLTSFSFTGQLIFDFLLTFQMPNMSKYVEKDNKNVFYSTTNKYCLLPSLTSFTHDRQQNRK